MMQRVSGLSPAMRSILSGQKSLSRVKENSSSPKKILVVGNGAVEGGWPPLAKALGCEPIKNPDTIAAILAGYTFQYRRLCNELLIGLHDGRTTPKQVEDLRLELHTLREHRWQVANAYQTACTIGTISLRTSEPVQELLASADEVGVITTNWDSLLWNAPIPNLIQLHGWCDLFETLIFPSELGTDEDIYELACLTTVSVEVRSTIRELGKHYRGSMAVELKKAHSLAMQWLKEAESITVWGLALHPYDAELLTVLQSWAKGRTKWEPGCVSVINPRQSDRERVATILGAPTWVRREYDPVTKKWVVDCLQNVLQR